MKPTAIRVEQWSAAQAQDSVPTTVQDGCVPGLPFLMHALRTAAEPDKVHHLFPSSTLAVSCCYNLKGKLRAIWLTWYNKGGVMEYNDKLALKACKFRMSN